MKTVQRFDIAELKKASRTAQGFLKAPVRATRTGIFIYKDAKGKEFRELRLPDEVFAKPSMESVIMIPITNNHRYEFVDSFNAKTHMVGYTGENVYKDEDTFLSTTAIITDERTIKEVESKEKEQVSLGYKAALEKAGKSAVEVNGLVPLFSISKERMRTLMWDDLKKQQ